MSDNVENGTPATMKDMHVAGRPNDSILRLIDCLPDGNARTELILREYERCVKLDDRRFDLENARLDKEHARRVAEEERRVVMHNKRCAESDALLLANAELHQQKFVESMMFSHDNLVLVSYP